MRRVIWVSYRIRICATEGSNKFNRWEKSGALYRRAEGGPTAAMNDLVTQICDSPHGDKLCLYEANSYATPIAIPYFFKNKKHQPVG